jgi:hypothetical protein
MPLKLKDYLIISEVDKDGDVEIEMDTQEGRNIYVFIDQKELKELIEYLQNQLIT